MQKLISHLYPELSLPDLNETTRQLKMMEEGARILSELFIDLNDIVNPGRSDSEIFRYIELYLMEHEINTFLSDPYNCSGISVSLNDVAFHGSPKGYILEDNDIVKIDIAGMYKDIFIDRAWSYGVGNLSSCSKLLIETGWRAAIEGIKAVKPYGIIDDITFNVSSFVKEQGYNLVAEAQGHGISQILHDDPVIDFYNKQNNSRDRLLPTQVITIEPVVTAGNGQVIFDEKKGSAKTRDGKPAVHFEYMVFISENKITVPGIDVFL